MKLPRRRLYTDKAKATMEGSRKFSVYETVVFNHRKHTVVGIRYLPEQGWKVCLSFDATRKEVWVRQGEVKHVPEYKEEAIIRYEKEIEQLKDHIRNIEQGNF